MQKVGKVLNKLWPPIYAKQKAVCISKANGCLEKFKKNPTNQNAPARYRHGLRDARLHILEEF